MHLNIKLLLHLFEMHKNGYVWPSTSQLKAYLHKKSLSNKTFFANEYRIHTSKMSIIYWHLVKFYNKHFKFDDGSIAEIIMEIGS